MYLSLTGRQKLIRWWAYLVVELIDINKNNKINNNSNNSNTCNSKSK